MRTVVLVVIVAAAMCTAASAYSSPSPTLISYANSTGGTVYELDGPTGWANIGADPTVLTGLGPNGADAYYKPGTVSGTDDSTIAFWDFTGAAIADVGHNLAPGEYAGQVFVSSTNLTQDGNIVIGSKNGPWGYDTNPDGSHNTSFASWNGVDTSLAGWTGLSNWTGGYLWLSNDAQQDMTVAVKWNPWGGYKGCAVSGVRFSTNGDFTPEPSGLLALLAGLPALLMIRRKR